MNGGSRDGRVGAPVGGEWVGKGWSTFFWAACIFNFVVGALAMLSPEATVDTRIVGLLVFSFGIIYLLVARNPVRYSSVLWAGIVGKLGVVGLLIPVALADGGNPLLIGVLGLDAAFAIGFLVFLLKRSDDLIQQ